jgi:ribosomal protein L31
MCAGISTNMQRGDPSVHVNLILWMGPSDGPQPARPRRDSSEFLSHPDDLKAAIACVELCREIGNSAALRPFTEREVMSGNLKGAELKNFIRDAAVTYWYQTGTAKMGRDAMSTMDSKETIKWKDGKSYPLIKVEISSASHPFLHWKTAYYRYGRSHQRCQPGTSTSFSNRTSMRFEMRQFMFNGPEC